MLEQIHRAKTGALLRASVRLGALHAGATETQLDALSCYGEHIGLAFQIVDDILDIEQTSEALGKTAGKDVAQHKITFPAVYGLEASHRMAEEERLRAHESLASFGAQRALAARNRRPRGGTKSMKPARRRIDVLWSSAAWPHPAKRRKRCCWPGQCSSTGREWTNPARRLRRMRPSR